jgi:hypothetical protein
VTPPPWHHRLGSPAPGGRIVGVVTTHRPGQRPETRLIVRRWDNDEHVMIEDHATRPARSPGGQPNDGRSER